MRFTFEAFGATHIDRELVGIGERADDASPALHVVDEMITEHLVGQFSTEGAASGSRWAALADSTLAFKRAHEMPDKILQATRELVMSLTNPGEHPASFRNITANQLHRGSTVPYGKFHQSGTSRMPQRRIFNFTSMFKRSIMKTIGGYLRTGEAMRHA